MCMKKVKLSEELSTLNKDRDFIENLSEIVGGNRVIDLLLHLPFDYVISSKSSFELIKNGDCVCLPLIILSVDVPKVPLNFALRRKIPIKILTRFKEGNRDITLIFFKISQSMLDKIKVGSSFSFKGDIIIKNNSYSIIHPKIVFNESNNVEVLRRYSKINDKEIKDISTIVGVYSTSDNIKQSQIIKAIDVVFNNIDQGDIDEIDEFIAYLLDKLAIMTPFGKSGFLSSLLSLHKPKSLQDILENSFHRILLAVCEIFTCQILLALARLNKNQAGLVVRSKEPELLNAFINSLPFVLTNAQKNAINEITSDQASESKMMRLLQGDVGAGKSIVAFSAMLNCYYANYQSILMAPTAILAKQHYESFKKLCPAVSVELITGDITAKAKESIISAMRLGMLDVLIGTHALFQEKVNFNYNNRIGLFVIDEQHSFGVQQRIDLINKSRNADFLMMTATPIPRTIVMSLYGDIAVSILDEKPQDRKIINTSIVTIKKYNELVKSIAKKIRDNEKIYWVCPLVEEGDGKLNLLDVNSRYKSLIEELSIYSIQADKVGMLHGKMSAKEKDETMMNFKSGSKSLLVATTVIEVGVDVKDATVIVIEHAERFGLAQLHQLRGRVGRGDRQSYCVLLYYEPISEIAFERLSVIKKSNDGFYIAEQDLKIRGGGEILGAKQSGFRQFRFANFGRDKEIIKELSKYSRVIAKNFESHRYQKNINCVISLFNYINKGFISS
jgi:ATP-dependent DNA helicase RecG